MRVNLHDLGLGIRFLDTTPKIQKKKKGHYQESEDNPQNGRNCL